MVPQQLAGGDIYPALEKGTIDAAEWVGPYDDEKLGFYKVAPYLLLSGLVGRWHAQHFLINQAKWDELPKSYQAIVTAAAGLANVEELARYDARNPGALKRLVAGGAQLRAIPAAGDGSVPHRVERGERRDLGDQRRLQEGAGVDAGLPQRRVSVVAGRRVHLRQLHDPHRTRA